MRIIFESEKEKEEILEHFTRAACPSLLGLKKENKCTIVSCADCWGKALMEMEMEVEEATG